MFFYHPESLSQTQKAELFKQWTVFRFVDNDLWLLNLYLKIKGTQMYYSWFNIHVFYQNSQGELFKIWTVFRFVDSDLWLLNLYHKHKGFSLEWIFIKHELLLHVFKGSNFYLQIIHWYDFIQAWTDVTHLFKMSLEFFPQSEHLYGFIHIKWRGSHK